MIPLDDKAWSPLYSDAPTGLELRAKRAYQGGPSDLYIGVDSSGFRHILAESEQFEELADHWKGHGLRLSLRLLVINGDSPKRYLDLFCVNPEAFPVLNWLVAEVSKNAIATEGSADVSLMETVEKWRHIWKTLPSKALSENEQVGLFAELWFLSEWLIPEVGTSHAVTAWKGPKKRRHDFEWGTSALEVKASTSSRGRIHTIHGIDQLDSPEEGILWLFSICLRKEDSASNDLTSLVSRCRALLSKDSSSHASFEELLGEIGYSDFHESDYRETTYRVVSEALFEVSDMFPRLSISSLIDGLPQEVEHVDYELNLNSETETLVATSVEEIKGRSYFR